MNLGLDDLKQWKMIIRQALAEFIGTFLYISLALLASIVAPNSVVEAFTHGLLIASIVHIFGHISGGHINPAVTLSILIFGEIKLIKSLIYVAAQILGALGGAAVSYVIIPSSTTATLGATIPNKSLTALQVCGIELLMTFVLTSVVITSTRRGLSPSLSIGFTLMACMFAGGPFTRSLNPARSFGPAVVINIWTLHWVYWVGPFAGAILAGLTQRFIFAYDSTIYSDQNRVSVIN